MREAFEQTGAAAVMLARGALGNPWLFAELLGAARAARRRRARSLRRARLDDRPRRRALGEPRAARYLRKFYPWYVARLRAGRAERASACRRRCSSADDARRRARGCCGALRDGARAGASERRSAGLARPRYTAALAGGRPPRSSPLTAGFCVSAPAGPRTAIEGHMPKDVILTPEGLKKLKDELELLSTEKRREVAERIKEAREFGDISENSEYDDAKNEQAMLESRIAQLEEKLRMATRDRGQGPLDRRRAGRLGRARQGRKDRQVGQVHDRRLGRGQAATSTSSPTSRRSAAR